MPERELPAVTPPVLAIERQARWPAPALLAFGGILVGFLVIAVLPRIAPPRFLEGLPDDSNVRAAAAAVRGLTPLPRSPLAFASALFGTEDGGARPSATVDRRGALIRAREALDRADRGWGTDPRVRVFLGHLDLAEAAAAAEAGNARRTVILLGRAERRYRSVTDGRDEVPEARMGLAAALELRAGRDADAERRRGYRLMAIAQLAAVREHDRIYPVALRDRALLLAQADRLADARRCAAELAALPGGAASAAELRRTLDRWGAR